MQFKLDNVESDEGRSVSVAVDYGTSSLVVTIEVGDTNRYIFLNRAEASLLATALQAAAECLDPNY